MRLLDSVVIILVSSALFVYWFRYTCLLILSERSSTDYALKVAATIRLSFPEIQQALQVGAETPVLDRLHESLEKDYRILTDLLRHAGDGDSVERRILTIDYRVMNLRYRLTSSPQALREMSTILGYFAAEIGQRAT